MSIDWVPYACLILALMSALVGGVLSAFSEFIMKSLLLTRGAGGVEAMQHINRTVMGTVFLASFLALAPLTAAFAGYAWLRLDGAAQTAVVAAAAAYWGTVFIVTIAGNVPMNERLARLDPASPEAQTYWRLYGRVWTRLNHIRTLGAIGTATLYLLAMHAAA